MQWIKLDRQDAEVAVVLLVVDGGWTAAPWVGVGGAVGVTAAMTLHRWARER